MKLTASLRLHCQIAAAGIAFKRPVHSELGENLPHTAGRAKNVAGRVHSERKEEDDEDDDQGVDVVGDESGLDTSKEGISDDTCER